MGIPALWRIKEEPQSFLVGIRLLHSLPCEKRRWASTGLRNRLRTEVAGSEGLRVWKESRDVGKFRTREWLNCVTLSEFNAGIDG